MYNFFSMNAVTLHPYLFFNGNCKEAMHFYQSVFGGELTIITYGEGNSDSPPEEMKIMDDKVMNASLLGGQIELMASDGSRTEPYPESFISLALGGANQEKLESLFLALSEGGTKIAELKKEMWGDIFGSVTDKFGIDWMVNISQS